MIIQIKNEVHCISMPLLLLDKRKNQLKQLKFKKRILKKIKGQCSQKETFTVSQFENGMSESREGRPTSNVQTLP